MFPPSQFIDGVDFNCGCPQPWVVKEGIGAALSNAPEKVAELVKAARAALPADKTVSVKIRLRPNLQQTVELVRRAEKMGADWITVHGRTQVRFLPSWSVVDVFLVICIVPRVLCS